MKRTTGERQMRLENLTIADLACSADLASQYSDTNIGFADAAVVAVAERLQIRTLLTVDRRHFSMIRPRHCDAFTIVP